MDFFDFLKDLSDTTKERLKTPLSGAFLWSFIIFNWRPILFLIFSEESIENKIIVINYEYCSPSALGWPILLAFFYTLIIPRLMLLIDKNLSKTNDERITKRYDGIEHKTLQKKKVAKAEYELKNIESGSQSIDELLTQIEGLKDSNRNLQESIKQINESHKVTVDELQNSLKLANEINEENYRKSAIDALKNDSAPPINISNSHVEDLEYFRQFKILVDNEKMSRSVKNKILQIGAMLTKAEFIFLQDSQISDGNIMINELESLNMMRSFTEKGIVQEQIQQGVISFPLTINGAIIINLLKRGITLSN